MRSFIALSLLLFLSVISCTALKQRIPMLREEVKPHVVLATQDRSPQMVVLIRDLDLPVRLHPRGPMPFTQNSHAVLIVGHAFPYDKLREILEFARNYYTDLHYVQVTDPLNPRTPYDHHARLFIGGETDKAIKAGLQPWTEADFKELQKVGSQKEMVELIRRKNGRSNGQKP